MPKASCATGSFRFRLLLPALLGLAAADPPPPAVTVASVDVKAVAPVQTYVGQVVAIQSVNIVARVDAYIDQLSFTEGSMVQKGQLLFELQKGPYQAALLQSQGALAQAQATQKNAQMNYERDAHAGNLAISQQQLQQDQASQAVGTGQVDAAQGALENAAINLGYTTLVAPITGQIGRALFTQGNFVGPTSGPLAVIVQMDPIRVSFAVPDAEVESMLQRAGETRQQMADALILHIHLSNSTPYSQPGKVEFINNQVDPATGTLTVYGRFANPNSVLIPGSYVSVDVSLAKPEKRPVIPVQAVQTDAKGQFVLLVGKDSKVAEQRVALGRQIGQEYIVTDGVAGGERVITQGVQKVHPGEIVTASEAPAAPAGGGAEGSPGGTNGAANGG